MFDNEGKTVLKIGSTYEITSGPRKGLYGTLIAEAVSVTGLDGENAGENLLLLDPNGWYFVVPAYYADYCLVPKG